MEIPILTTTSPAPIPRLSIPMTISIPMMRRPKGLRRRLQQTRRLMMTEQKSLAIAVRLLPVSVFCALTSRFRFSVRLVTFIACSRPERLRPDSKSKDQPGPSKSLSPIQYLKQIYTEIVPDPKDSAKQLCKCRLCGKAYFMGMSALRYVCLVLSSRRPSSCGCADLSVV